MELMQFLNSQFFRQALMIVLLTISVFFASTGGFQNPQWNDLLADVAVSILAAVISIYFLQDIEKRHDDDPERIAQVIQSVFDDINRSHFVRVDRNMDMGDEYWVSLINELDVTPEPSWFVGTRLSWWLKTRTYREPLRAKLKARFKLAASDYKDSNEEGEERYKIYILLANPDWVPKWKDFLGSIIEEFTQDKGKLETKQLSDLCWDKIEIAILSPELTRYSLILCGERLTVTQYISVGRSEDSPTLEIRKGSVIRDLYLDDLKILKSKAKTLELEI
jgi:hypothetical protein